MYGGSLGLQTTVNIGVNDLKPVLVSSDCLIVGELMLTTNGELWTAGSKLQEISPLRQRKLAHSLQQVLDTLAIHVEAVVSLDRVHES